MQILERISALPLNRKHIYLAGLVLLAVLLTAIYSIKTFSVKNSALPEAREITVQRGNLRIAVEADGKADFSSVSLRSQISGAIQEINVKPGDPVKKGDVIARLDAEKYQLEVDMAAANYQAAQARLARAKENYNQKLLAESQKLDVLSREYKPMQEAPDIYSPQEIALKKTAYEYAVESYEEARAGTADIRLEEAGVAQAMANLNKARSAAEDTVIKAPFNGKIISLPVEAGESVSGSTANSSTEIAVLSRDDGVYVTASVLELDMSNITPGLAAEVKFEALRDSTYKGTVTSIEALPVNDPGGIVSYLVSVRLTEPDPRILSGMTALVAFIIEEKRYVLVIPNQAVKRVDGAQVVEIKGEDGKTAYKKIRTGFTDGHNVEVTEGLQAGDKILIPGGGDAQGKESL